MNAKKHPPVDLPDPSLNPTRKVESMSSIAAELLLQEHDNRVGDVGDGRIDEGRVDEGRFDEQSRRRLRSNRPPALDAYSEPSVPGQTDPWRPVYADPSAHSEPWRPVYSDSAAWQSQGWRPSVPPPFGNPPPPATRSVAARIALLVAGALILVALSVTATLLVTR